jgi:cell division protein FtsW
VDRSLFTTGFWRSAFSRQAVFVVAGFLTILLSACLARHALLWSRRTWVILVLVLLTVTVAALVAVLFPGIGTEVNGARRWITLGPASLGLRFQPSELAKLSVVIGLAILLSRSASTIRSFGRGLLPCAVVVGVLAGLVGREDFGTAALLVLVGGLMMLVGGCRIYQLALLSIPGLAAMLYLVVSEPHRIERVMAFRNIWDDPYHSGYQPIQSLITIASGGWTGRGLGAGVQKYGYLPEARTDFIFSVICEEAGVLGATVIILLFAALLYLGFRALWNAPNAFQRMIALGITLVISLQAAMNIAVVTVCVPTKGIALPLVSAGGSGVIFLGAAIGLLAAVAASGRPEVFRAESEAREAALPASAW